MKLTELPLGDAAPSADCIDRLTILQLAIGEATVDRTFQRVGDRVTAFPEGRDPSPVPVVLHA